MWFSLPFWSSCIWRWVSTGDTSWHIYISWHGQSLQLFIVVIFSMTTVTTTTFLSREPYVFSDRSPSSNLWVQSHYYSQLWCFSNCYRHVSAVEWYVGFPWLFMQARQFPFLALVATKLVLFLFPLLENYLYRWVLWHNASARVTVCHDESVELSGGI